MTDDHSIHATCVALGGRAVLLQGPSGAGKSTLGLTLMGMGCMLVADDRVLLHADGSDVIATCPTTLQGLIEARGVGILEADHVSHAKVVLVVDLAQKEDKRLPKRRTVTLLGQNVPLIGHIPDPHFAPAILQILKAGWSNR